MLYVKVINDTPTDLSAKVAGSGTPFQPGFSAVAINLQASATPLVQHSDDGVTYETAVQLGVAASATQIASIPKLKRFVKVSTAVPVFLLAGI